MGTCKDCIHVGNGLCYDHPDCDGATQVSEDYSCSNFESGEVISIDLPQETWEWLQRESEKRGISLNNFVNKILRKYLERYGS